jgi:copper(I)-binding protein
MTNSWIRGALVGVLLTVGAAGAQAHEYELGELAIGHPWTRAVPQGQPAAGGYFTIANHGSDADRLVSATSPAARAVELHDMTIENGVMKMRPVEGGIEIPAGGTVALAPGGMHAMLIGPTQAFKPGERIPLSLTFEKAGTVQVELAVEKPGAAAKPVADHDSHGDHGDHGGGHGGQDTGG